MSGLEGLWALSRAFVFPSLYEGFVLPSFQEGFGLAGRGFAAAIHCYTSSAAMAPTTTKQSVAFRFDPITVRRLKQRARETHAAQTALAERYIEEGLRRDEHQLISFRDGEAGRRPALLGTRLDVADVITTIRQNDNSVEEAAAYLEIPVEQIDACVRYYADYKDEVDAWIERSRAIAQRERERSQRRRQALA
jgi:uncharacterized protein (DUF433 family)